MSSRTLCADLLSKDFSTHAKWFHIKSLVNFCERKKVLREFPKTLSPHDPTWLGSPPMHLLLQLLLRNPLCLFAVFFAGLIPVKYGIQTRETRKNFMRLLSLLDRFFLFFLFIKAVNLGDLSGRCRFLEPDTIYFQLFYYWISVRGDVHEIFCVDCSSSEPLLPCFMFLTFFFRATFGPPGVIVFIIISRKETRKRKSQN